MACIRPASTVSGQAGREECTNTNISLIECSTQEYKRARQPIWMVLLWYFELRKAILEAAGHDNGAHVIGFCSNGVLAFLTGAQE